MSLLYSVKHAINFGFSLAEVQFKERNEGSYLGILWYLLNPILMFGLLLLIFYDRVGGEIKHYPLYLLLGIIIFNYFQRVTTESTICIPVNKGIIKSVNFPRLALVGSIVITHIFSHFFEILLLLLFLIYYKVSPVGIIVYPIVLIFFSLFVYGISLMLAAIHVYFIDLKHIWDFLARLIWLGTPIFYPIGGQKRLFIVNLFNPIYYYMTISRDIIIYHEMPPLWMIAGAAFYSIMFFVIGFLVFSKLKNKFAEMI
ncbi:MAG: ABC transporter permease [Candidatus Omnitrophica bacterium]|nr:ABC transporter permease [Candidatus Omnitrophota bacterium]